MHRPIVHKDLCEHIHTYTQISFEVYWPLLWSSDEVTLRYPHARHGNAGSKPNLSKTSVMEECPNFAYANSPSNCRRADLRGPTNYSAKLYNFSNACKEPFTLWGRSQLLKGLIMHSVRLAVGNALMAFCHNRLKLHRPEETSLKADYLKSFEISSSFATSWPGCLEEEIKRHFNIPSKTIREKLQNHEYYTNVVKKCCSKMAQNCGIRTISEPSTDEQEFLKVLHRS